MAKLQTKLDMAYSYELQNLIDKHIKKRQFCSVLEVGGIDRPLLRKAEGYIYDGLDIEYKPACKMIYDHFYVQSVEEPIRNKYDIIISKTVLEHVKNNFLSAHQMYKALNRGGITIHYVPCKYHPYSLILRTTRPGLQKTLIRILRPWAIGTTGYIAFFDRCSPKEMGKVFDKVGYKNINIIRFYNANDYFRFFFPFYMIVTLWEWVCRIFKMQQLCSGFIIEAEKE